MLKRKTLFLVALLAFFLGLSLANAETVKEQTLEGLGVAGLKIEDANSFDCMEFVYLLHKGEIAQGLYHYLSLHAKLAPVGEGEATIDVFLNELRLAEIKPKDLSDGWHRLKVSDRLLKQQNTFKICGKTSFSITGIEILRDSKIGVYKVADFDHKDSFTKEVSTPFPFVNKPFTVTITIRNYGSADADVYVNYEIVKLDKVQLIGGETEFTGTIPAFDFKTKTPGKKSFSYEMFPTQEIRMTLPAATIEYTNAFGEEIFRRSTQPDLWVRPLLRKISSMLVLEKAINLVNEKSQGKIVLKNLGQQPLQNVAVYFLPGEGLKLDKGEETGLVLAPEETVEIPFTATALSQGRYEIGCKIVYIDSNVVEEFCEPDYFFFEGQETNYTLLFGAVLAAVAVLVYLFIYLKK